MKKLLDTTFLIHYWRGLDKIADYLEKHEESKFITTTLNIKEIAVGRALQEKLDQYEISSTFNWIDIIPFDINHAFHASKLEAKLYQNPDINQDRINSLTGDLLIAAIAKEKKATVVTQNTDDFELFDDVYVESY